VSGLNWLRQLLINRDFGLLLMGRLVSQIGDGVHYFAMAWLVLDLTGSGSALGTLLMVASIPGLILTPFTGVLADIANRKRIVITMDVVRGILLLGLALIYGTGNLTLPILYVVTAALSLCGALFGPAIVATMPGLVKREELVKANARDAFSNSATGILGPIVGAMLLAGYGYLGIFLINGGSFLISAISEAFIRFPEREAQPRNTAPGAGAKFMSDLGDGFRYLWSNPGLRVLMIGGIALNFLFSPLFGVVFPYFGKEVLKMIPEHYGISQSSLPVGMLLGTIAVAAIAQRVPKVKLLIGGVTIQGILMMVVGLLALPIVYGRMSPLGTIMSLAIPLFFMGLMNVLVNVPLNVLMQEIVPENYRGRVFSLLGSTMNVAAPLGMGLIGIFMNLIPVHFLFFIGGGLVVFMALTLGVSPALHKLYSPKGEAEKDEKIVVEGRVTHV